MPGVRSALIVALALGLGLVAAGATCNGWLSSQHDEFIFLGGGPANWIVAPVAPRMGAQVPADLETTFERRLDPGPEARTLTVRALGRATVTLNGRVVARPTDFPASWKQALTIDVVDALRPGTDTLRVSVVRSTGPAALNLTLDATGTDEDWVASIAGSNPRAARLATRHPEIDPGLPGTEGRSPLGALAASVPTLGIFFLMSILLAFGVARMPDGWSSRLPAVATAVAVLAWIVLFVHNAGQFPETTGFDARGHLDYIRYILDEGAVPLASQGWQMYQPPLFYVVSAAALRLFSGGEFDPQILRAVTFGAGIAQILLLGAIARLLWPRRLTPLVLALGFGACLPMHLYLFHFVSNETLAMPLNTAVSYLVIRLLLNNTTPSMKTCVGLGACLGLAFLAKFSAVVLLPLVLGAAAFAFYRSGADRSTAIVRVAAVLAACGVACGWHFGRVWVQLGNPLIGNWDPSLGFPWWQAPGFRTIADYTSFGRSLSAPWFGGLGGVLDGAYSTLWGDALASGATEVQYGAPWNHRLVSAGYALSALPMIAIFIGCAAGGWRILRRRLDASRRAVAVYLATLATVVVAALVYMTLLVPSYAQSKAFYIQPAMAALCVAFVFGTLRLLEFDRRLRPALLVALSVCGMTFFGSVWIRPDAPETRIQQGWLALATRDAVAAESRFREALEHDDDHAGALTGLAVASAEQKRWADAATAAARSLELVSPEEHPRLTARALNAAALAEIAAGNTAAAEGSLRRAIEIAPTERQNYRPLVRLLLNQGRVADAASVLRDELWIAPHDENLHRLLADFSRRRP
jgi:4-amino-4-deoxy-L-arabinose transferase-like glycosyltransferase